MLLCTQFGLENTGYIHQNQLPHNYSPLNLTLCSSPQIIKVSTTAPGLITNTTLRVPRHHKHKPRGTWATRPPRAPRAPLWGAWSTTTLGTIRPVTCRATQTSSRSTPGTRRVRSPAAPLPCRASPVRCVALARPSRPCL